MGLAYHCGRISICSRVALDLAVGEDRPHLEEVGARRQVDERGVVASVLGDLPVVVQPLDAVGVAVVREREVEIGELQREGVAVVGEDEPSGDVDVPGQQDVAPEAFADADPVVVDGQSGDAGAERFVVEREVGARDGVVTVGGSGVDLFAVDQTALKRVVSDPVVADGPSRADVVGRKDGVADRPDALPVGRHDPYGEPRSGNFADRILVPDVESRIGSDEDPVALAVERLGADAGRQFDRPDLVGFGVDRDRAFVGGDEAQVAVYGDLRGDVARKTAVGGAEVQIGAVVGRRTLQQPLLVDDEDSPFVGADPEPAAIVLADAVHPRGVVVPGGLRDGEAAETVTRVFIEVQSAVRGDPDADLVGIQTADLVVGDALFDAAVIGLEPGGVLGVDADQPVLAAQPERPFPILAEGPDGQTLVAAGDRSQRDEGVEAASGGHADAVVGGDPDVAAVVFVDARDDVVGNRRGVARFVYEVLPPAVGAEDEDPLVGAGPEAPVAAAAETAHGDVIEQHRGLAGGGVEADQSVFGPEQQRPRNLERRDDVADQIAVPAVEQRNGDLLHLAGAVLCINAVVGSEVGLSVDLAAAGDVRSVEDLPRTAGGEALPVAGQEHEPRGGADPQRIVVLEQRADVELGAGLDLFEAVADRIVERQPLVGPDQHPLSVAQAEQGVDRIVAQRGGVLRVVYVGNRSVRVVADQTVGRSGPDVSVVVGDDGEDRVEAVPEPLEVGADGLGSDLSGQAGQKQPEQDGQAEEDRFMCHGALCLYDFIQI